MNVLKNAVNAVYAVLPKNDNGSVMLRDLVRGCGYGDTSEFISAVRAAGIDLKTRCVPGLGITAKL